MFTHDFTADFDAVLAAERPFALVRFGDGEAKLLAHEAYRSADAWISSDAKTWIADPLRASLEYVDDGYHIGLPPQCCMAIFATLANHCPTPHHRITSATIFLHANLHRIGELVDRYDGACIVGSGIGEIRIPTDGVTQPWDLDDVVERLLDVDRPILLAAGPCANVIAHRYWQRQEPARRVTILDVGSALDVWQGRKTRHYHDPQSPLLSHRCQWMLSGPTAGVDHPMPATRIRLGRSAIRNTNNAAPAAAPATPNGLVRTRSGPINVSTSAVRTGGCSSCAGRVRK